MSENPARHEITLRRIQLWVGILAAVASLIVGAYNLKNIFFKKPEPVKAAPPRQSDAIREAVEEVGASWIKKLGSAESD